MSRMLALLLATFAGASACERGGERRTTTPQAVETNREPPARAAAPRGLPADAVAMVDGVAISYARFVEAYQEELVRRADPFRRPNKRDPVAHVIDELVYAELLRAELARRGTTTDDVLTGAPHTLVAVLQVATSSHARTHGFSTVITDELAVAISRGALTVSDAALAKEYAARAAELVSTEGWLRFDVLTVGFAGFAGGGVGVEICDQYVARARACAAKAPEGERAELLAHADEQLKFWRSLVGDPKLQDDLWDYCRVMLDESEGSCRSVGALPDPSRGLAKRKADARRSAMALRKLAAVPGADFSAIANGRGRGVAARRRFEAIDQLAPAIAGAVAKLGVGGVTPVVLDGDGWTIARVVERLPAGPAPLEVRRDAFVGDIVLRQVVAELDGLFGELSGGREIVIRTPLPKLPSKP